MNSGGLVSVLDHGGQVGPGIDDRGHEVAARVSVLVGATDNHFEVWIRQFQLKKSSHFKTLKNAQFNCSHEKIKDLKFSAFFIVLSVHKKMSMAHCNPTIVKSFRLIYN